MRTEYRIIGQDDWLIFARRQSDNALVYTVIEVDSAWLGSPHKGEAEHGTPEWAEDWRFMIRRVMLSPSDYRWEAAEYPLNMPDGDFYRRMCDRFDIQECPDYCPTCGVDLKAEGYPIGHQTDEGNICTFRWSS